MVEITGYVTVRIKATVTEEALANRELGHEVVQELDYNITSNTEGVEIVETEIVDYEINDFDDEE